MSLRKIEMVLAAVVAVTFVAACGSSPSSSTGGKVDAAALKASQSRYDAFVAGTDRALPTTSPAPQTGKKVWVIACSTAAEGCATPGEAAKEAGAKLGWEVTVQDGKLDPNVYNSVIRSAITANVDGIVLVAIDCAPIQASLKAAEAAGIKVLGVQSVDCSQKYTGGDPLFSAQTSYCPEPTADPAKLQECFETFLSDEYARNQVDYTIVKTEGRAEVIVMQENDTLEPRLVGEAYQEWMKQCSSCVVHVVDFTGQDLLNSSLQEKASAALNRYPNANAVMLPYDAAGLLGVGSAVKSARASGRNILLVGAEGLTPAIKQIQAGDGQDFATGGPVGWWGWSAADALNRLFADEPQVDAGIGVQVIDQDHNLPTETTYYDGNAKSDYVANYLKIWGVS